MQALCHLVVLSGTGQAACIPEYRAGGKTGTAQIAINGAYDPDRYTAIFAGFAPVSKPQLVAVFAVREPMIKLHFGGYVSGPLFKKVVRDALIRLGVPEDPEIVDGKPMKSDLPGADKVASAKKEAEKASENAADKDEVDADTAMEHVDSKKFEESLDKLIEPLDGLQLVAHGPAMEGVTELPDFTGLSKRQAKERLATLGVPWDPQGAGWVVAQRPAPGTPLNQVSLCSLEFGNKHLEPGQKDENKSEKTSKADRSEKKKHDKKRT
jgi:membrane peptidoglycan carboxypeptidase